MDAIPSTRTDTARVLIVDDHPAVREGLALRISMQSGMDVCGEAADVTEALRLFETSQPDVIVVDISLKTGNGLDLIKRIAARNKRVRMLVWSMYPDRLYAERALRAGAHGYINKEQATGNIVRAIRTVLGGQVYLSEEMSDRMLQLAVGGANAMRQTPIDTLSDRELEVFKRIGGGVKTADIAEQMHLSIHTVETYRQRLKTKLNLASAAELARAATEWVLENE